MSDFPPEPESAEAYYAVLVTGGEGPPMLLARRWHAGDPFAGSWRFLDTDEADALSDAYNADPRQGGTAQTVEAFQFDADPIWTDNHTRPQEVTMKISHTPGEWDGSFALAVRNLIHDIVEGDDAPLHFRIVTEDDQEQRITRTVLVAGLTGDGDNSLDVRSNVVAGDYYASGRWAIPIEDLVSIEAAAPLDGEYVATTSGRVVDTARKGREVFDLCDNRQALDVARQLNAAVAAVAADAEVAEPFISPDVARLIDDALSDGTLDPDGILSEREKAGLRAVIEGPLAEGPPETAMDELGRIVRRGETVRVTATARLFLDIDPHSVGNPVTGALVGWGNVLDVVASDRSDVPVDLLQRVEGDLTDWGDAVYFGAIPEAQPTAYLVSQPGTATAVHLAAEVSATLMEAAGFTVTPLHRLRPDETPGGSCWIRGTTDA